MIGVVGRHVMLVLRRGSVGTGGSIIRVEGRVMVAAMLASR